MKNIDKSYKTISFIGLISIFISTILMIKMPLSNKIIREQKINVVIFIQKSQIYILELDTNMKNIILKEINAFQQYLRSKIDTASFILDKSGTDLYRKTQNVLYIETDLKNLNEITEYIKNWKYKPHFIFKLSKIFFNFQSNINLFDRLVLLTEILKINPKNFLYLKISLFDNLSSQNKSNNSTPLVALIISQAYKQKSIKYIATLLRKNNIDIIEEKKIFKKIPSTNIVIKNDNNLELAKKIIILLNQKQEIPIKINPKVIYDAEIYIGDDFKLGG
ncbi:MAG: hypothetical protein N2446_03115 [Elusimicrobiales bacterium]|nr:hypothetical protein [Elusimicrobiales bacterium]